MSQAVKRYCQQKNIRVINRPGGAVRFIGEGVDLLVASAFKVSVSDLQPYEPRKGHALRNV